jgi:hypothetical protein
MLSSSIKLGAATVEDEGGGGGGRAAMAVEEEGGGGGWSGLEERLARDAAVAMASEERLHI